MELSSETALNIAKNFRIHDAEIVAAIGKVAAANHGVVALRFSEKGTKMEIEILDEPYEDDVRIIPGE